MSKFRIMANLDCDTLTHAETIRDAFNLQLVGKSIFENHGVSASFNTHINKTLFISNLRMNIESERDTLWTYIIDKASTDVVVKNWVLSAKVNRHLCTHDDLKVKDCKTTSYEEFLK